MAKMNTRIRKKGYFGIGVYHSKNSVNIGTLWRTANIFGADYIFTIGRRYKGQASDTMKTPRLIPLYHYDTFDEFKKNLPWGCRIVAIEITPDAKHLKNFLHPKQACYVLGAEDTGIPEDILKKCNDVVQLGGEYCMNVATAGSIVIYDRVMTKQAG